MANMLSSTWRSFWHTMTSYDRHASHDSPYRTGRHVPLSQSRHEPLTSVATSAADSRPDLTNPYDDESPKGLATAQSTEFNGSPTELGSPNRPYSPGMRSLASQKRGSNEQADGPEIQMQSFHDGAPPPPPVGHSWRKIERWLEQNYEELLDNLGEGCTQNDINELEHELDCSLPLEVRESLMIHDGQERPGLPTGVLFSCMLLDCEEIVQERRNWKTVNDEFLSNSMINSAPVSSSAAGSSAAAAASQQANPGWRNDLLDRQDSQPPGAVQKAYAHHGWIPIARDWGGNHLAIDLAPGPAGKWGQVIIFGRDYDCKYVVARSWSAFLATFADDLCSSKVIVDEETNELRLKEFKSQNVNPPYLEILRWRTDQKYGRRAPRRRSNGPGANASGNRNSKDSPYGSPTRAEERGRSPNRFPNRGPAQSPKTPFGMSSPLARVTEETSSPIGTAGPTISEDSRETGTKEEPEDLLEVATPQISNKENEGFEKTETKSSDTDKTETDDAAGPSNVMNSEVLGEMKNVAI